MANYIIIPARMESKRLPNKPLLDKTGKYLIQHTWERCKKAQQLSNGNIQDVIIAVEEEELRKVCEGFGATVQVTYECKLAGTERSVVACSKLIDPIHVVSVQCEYPRIHPQSILKVYKELIELPQQIHSLAYYTQSKKPYYNHNRVKVITDFYKQALYFSRSPIPAYQNVKEKFAGSWIHVGIYGFYYPNFLDFYRAVWSGEYDVGIAHYEGLEQLRWMFCGIPTMIHSCENTLSVDSMEDYIEFVKLEQWAKPLPSV